MGTSAASAFNRIDDMSQAELDALPHGAIQLDQHGRILKYNEYESKISHLSKESVIGKNFFTDVAPCTHVQEFYGRFRKGAAEKNLHERFRYHFAFKKDPREMTVSLFYSDITDTIWVFIQPIEKI